MFSCWSSATTTSTSGAQAASLRRSCSIASLQRCHLATLSASVSAVSSGRTVNASLCRFCSRSQRSGGTISCGPFDIASQPISSAMGRLLDALHVHARKLMLERDLAAFFGRLQHGDADLKGGLAPSPIGKCRAILHDRLMELAQLGAAPRVGRARNFLTAPFRVNVDAARRLPDDAALAGHDGQAEERLLGALADGLLLGGAGGAVFGDRIDRAGETVFLPASLRLADALAAFADAPGQLGNIEEAVAVEHQGGAGSIIELEERRVIAFGGEILIRP